MGRATKARPMPDIGSVYEDMAPRICRYLERRLPAGHRHAAEDLAADVFVRALAAAGRYQDRGLPISSWLYRIAHNLLVDYLRALRFRAESLPDVERHDIDDRRTSADPSSVLDRVAIERALPSLTPLQRAVIERRYFDGLPVAQAASAAGVTVEAAKKLQQRGLASLRRALEAA